MTGREIPESVVMSAAKMVFADDLSDNLGKTAPEIMSACEALVRVAAPVIAKWAREQALAEAGMQSTIGDLAANLAEAIRGWDAANALIAAHRCNDQAERAYARAVAAEDALRRKEGGDV